MSSEPPSTTAVIVTVCDEQSVDVVAERIEHVARATAESEGARGEISITLVDPRRMAALNERYLGKTGPTDVLAFPIDGPGGPSARHEPHGPPRMIGEVVLCPEVALRQESWSLDAELDLLVAHGVLHLLGFDHDTESGAEQMRMRECKLTGRSGASA